VKFQSTVLMPPQAVLRAGILIIGSLLWDPDLNEGDRVRAAWRAAHLYSCRKQRVKVKIRYGRLSTSGKRECQYTMTFSNAAGLGRAYVLPCQRPIAQFSDLAAEATALAKAEGFVRTSGSWKTFGAVGIAFRSNEVFNAWHHQWIDFSRRQTSAILEVRNGYRAYGEGPPLSDDATLDIDWPICEESETDVDYDVLLATANAPRSISLGRYDTPVEIAQSVVRRAPGKADYFQRNVANGIRTVEDVAIWEAVERLNPPWVNQGQYHDLSQLVRQPI
jgi:hypothetical protein